MRPSLFLAGAVLTSVAVLGAAPNATAQPAGPVADAGTGSSVVDSASRAAQSAVELAQRGDLIGFIVLMAITPIQMVTGGVCDLAVGAGSSNPCSPTRY
ncbi:hypothetical protein ACFVAV_17990 [Nocardia sp. NPDC057663]|uniref:hypothetical protein n=1 Tax=Nocardia sp. NPDC057663 TaxID=3346201 RepID=UPI003671B977